MGKGRLLGQAGRCFSASLLGLLVAVTPVAAQKSPQQVVEELNRDAMEAYNALDINKAGSMLEEALRVSSGGGVPPQLVARTNLNLGIVYIGGLGDQDNGLGYFVQAVCMDPSVQLDPLTSTPDIQNVMNVAIQRARGGACPTGPAPPGAVGLQPMAPAQPMQPMPPPQPVAPPPEQALAHRSPVEQLSQTPLPLYVEVNPLAQAKKIYVYYKGLGMKEYKRVPMYQYQNGFAYQISCEDVWEPKVSYYIEAQSADGRVVGVIGSAAQPIEVPIVAARKQPEPSLPGAQPPTSCVAKECPPGMAGCKASKKASAAIGDSCSANADCQSGLECRDDECALIGAGGTEVPEINPATGAYQPTSPTSSGPEELKLNFVQLGFTVGLAYVQAGMVADRPPPNNRVFVAQGTSMYIEDPYAALAAGQQVEFPTPGTASESLLNSWVPDADSSDSLGPLKGNCSADGVPSGPTDPLHQLPTKYCVRVKAPGFVPNLAMRLALGRFITPRIAVAALMRLQFVSGKGALNNLLFGARAEYVLTKPKAKGLMLSAFAGVTAGEIQAKPPATGTTKNAPFVKSGMMGAHIGSNVRYRITPNVGLFAAPEIDVQFPTLLVNIDLTLAGVEAAF